MARIALMMGEDFLLVGMAALIPTILVYMACSYCVFRSKIGGAECYHLNLPGSHSLPLATSMRK